MRPNYSRLSTQPQENSDDQCYPPLMKGFKFDRILGRGGYGCVCLYVKNDIKVAIKFEKTDGNFQVNTILNESLILKKLSKNKVNFEPAYIDHGLAKHAMKGKEINYNYLMLSYLDEPLADYYQRKKQSLNISKIFLGMLDALQQIHDAGIIHRDISLNNFMVKNDSIKIIDFGTSREYMLRDNQHISLQTGKQLRGTTYTASSFNHQGYELSRRDDIISMIYCAMTLILDKLPWYEESLNYNAKDAQQQILSSSILQKKIEMFEKRQDFEDDRIIKLLELIKTIEKCSFDKRPDYQYI
ncbi:casein kinase i [Stylonychia lemnae]|uniref:Casein kinase I n=1 Tax=Stylonychia lemnae TaxID=5949 RepID=A0A078B7L4_STYLE|nr:casein kinase i [Stylonychia lemnae]|eukprot:CDW89292.1 casein kinase i [Stylonychia lemnae]